MTLISGACVDLPLLPTNWASSNVFTSHQKVKAKSQGYFRFLRFPTQLPQASWLKMKAFSSGILWLQFPSQSCELSKNMDQSHHTASGGDGSLGRGQLYLPGPEAQSRRRENVRTCPGQTGGEWKGYLIKRLPEAAGTEKRRHGRQYANRLVEMCREERSWTTGYMHLSQRSHIQMHLGATLVTPVTETTWV